MRELTGACADSEKSPSEIVHRVHRALHLAALAAERYHISGTCRRLQTVDAPIVSHGSNSNNSFRISAASESETLPPFGADELLPIVTWLLIQTNPPGIETLVWYCSEFRHHELAFGHSNYSFTQVSSALEFIKTAGPDEICISIDDSGTSKTEQLLLRLTRYKKTQMLIEQCKKGNRITSIRQLIMQDGADVNGYTPDKNDTPLSAAVRFHQLEVMKSLLSFAGRRSASNEQPCHNDLGDPVSLFVDTPINPHHAGCPPYCFTCLHLAVRLGDIDAVLLLLNAGANRYACDSEGNTPLSIAANSGVSSIQKLLISDCSLYSLVSAVVKGSVAIVEGLMEQNIDASEMDNLFQLTPLMSSVLIKNECILTLLTKYLHTSNANTEAMNVSDANGSTALMFCSKHGKSNPGVQYDISMRHPPGKSGLSWGFVYYDQAVALISSDRDHDDYLRMKLAVRLLNSGADLSIVDKRGLNAFSLALLEGFIKNESKFPTNCPKSEISGCETILPVRSVISSPILPEPTRSVFTPLSDLGTFTPISHVAASLIQSIDCASEKYGTVDSEMWCGYPKLAAVLQYTPSSHKLYQCARDNDAHGVQALLNLGEDPNIACPIEDYTPLIAAIYNENIIIFDILLADSRTDLNIPRVSSRGMTSLHFAAVKGNATLTGRLLWAGADRHAVTYDNRRALDFAKYTGNQDLIDILNFNPSDISIALAAKHGDIRVSRALIAQGASINTRRKHFCGSNMKHQLYTPLIAAAAYGQIDYINFLLEVSEQNKNNKQSAQPNAPSIFDELDVDVVNPDGHTALMCAAMVGHEKIVLLLLNRGKANRYLVDKGYATAADWAKRRGFQSIFNVLNFDPRKCSIHAFVSSGNLDACVALFKQNIDPNEPFFAFGDVNRTNTSMSGVIDGETPLGVAARRNHLGIMRLLLKAPGIRTDSQDTEGVSPLGRAAEAGNEKAVLLLLQNGCSRTLADVHGNRPMDRALRNSHIGIAAVLEADPQVVNCSDLCVEGRVSGYQLRIRHVYSEFKSYFSIGRFSRGIAEARFFSEPYRQQTRYFLISSFSLIADLYVPK